MSDEDYKNPLVQSDVPEKIATGVESFYRGALPTGVFDTLEEKLGGASPQDIKAREEAHSGISHATEFTGNLLRDTAAVALGGPLAMYGVAAANTAGQTVHEAINHDPDLTTEHVASTLLREMLGATIGLVGGAVLDKAGRAIMGGAKAVGKRLMQGGWRAEALAAKSELDAAAEKAFEQGIFSKARAKGIEESDRKLADIGDKMNTMLKPVDQIAKMRRLGLKIDKSARDEGELSKIMQWTEKETAKAQKAHAAAQPQDTEISKIMDWTGKETAKAQGAAAKAAEASMPQESELQQIMGWTQKEAGKAAGMRKAPKGAEPYHSVEGFEGANAQAPAASADASVPEAFRRAPAVEVAPAEVTRGQDVTASLGEANSSGAPEALQASGTPAGAEAPIAQKPVTVQGVPPPAAGIEAAPPPPKAQGADAFMDIEGEIHKRLQATLRQIRFTNSGDAEAQLSKIARQISKGEPLTATEVLRIENNLGKLGEAVNDLQKGKGGRDNAANVIWGLRDQVKQLNNKYFAELGMSPEEYRALEREYLAQSHVKASIPTDTLKPMLKIGAKAVASGLAGWGVNEGAQALGVPKEYARSAGAVVGTALGAKSLGGLRELPIGKAIAGYGAQKAYSFGKLLSEYDKGIFKQVLANQFGNELGVVASNGLSRGLLQTASQYALPSDAVEKIQHFAQHPDVFKREAEARIEDAPIDENTKIDVFNQLDQDMKYLSQDLPPSRPFSPPGARAMTASKRLKLERKIAALAHTPSALANPTKEGLEAVKQRRTKTHSAHIEHVLDQAGPNIEPGTPARVYLDLLGADDSIKKAGRDAQKLYAPKPMPAKGKQKAPAPNVTFHQDVASTALDDAQKGRP